MVCDGVWLMVCAGPTESWTSLEYGGRFKLLHYAATRFNAPVTVSSYCLPSITNCTGTLFHVKSELLDRFTGTLEVSAVRWADGFHGAAATAEVALDSQAGASFNYTGAAFLSLLTAAGCDKKNPVSTCFLQARLLSAAGVVRGAASSPDPELMAPVNYQWLTLWRDAALTATRFTITAQPERASSSATGAVAVTVSSSAVAPYVMVHCGLPTDFGAFDDNGILMLPGESRTLIYTPKAFAPAGEHVPCSQAADFYAVSMNGLSTGAQTAVSHPG